ncbi:MAG: zinc ribbon domain-containing protein [Candidatus Hodarchaeota archaeon]
MKEIRFLTTVETVLKNRRQLFANIHDSRDLTQYFVDFQIAIFLFAFVYGAAMGLFSGGIQILYSAFKVPLLLFLTLYICVPTFYVLDSLVGGALSLRQMLTILLAGFTIMVTILLAFLPVMLFFLLTTPDYTFIVLLNVAIFGLAGAGALIYFLQGYFTIYGLETEPGPQIAQTSNCPSCKKSIKSDQAFCDHCGTRLMRALDKGFDISSLPILIGCLVLIFVGTQLAWILRPYFHFYPFFIRPLEGNFYMALLKLIFPWFR